MPDPNQIAREALVEEIHSAFGGERLGEGITLHQAYALDEYHTPDEVKYARILDTETRWQELKPENIYKCRTVLHKLDAQGFRFYIPALMIFGIVNDSKRSEDVLFYSTHWFLHDSENCHARFSPESLSEKYALTQKQIVVVPKFLYFAFFEKLNFRLPHIEKAIISWKLFAESGISE